jgi:hypothetical protein
MHHDLWSGEAWPFEPGSIERLRAWHVIEHIPHDRIRIGTASAKVARKRPGMPPVITQQPYPLTQDAFFWFFDEAYRVAAPGCTFELAWPHPWHEHSDQDPTHCRRVTVATLHYLSLEGRRTMRVHHYPVSCDWQIHGHPMMIGTDEALEAHPSPGAAARHVGAYHEIRATLIKR